MMVQRGRVPPEKRPGTGRPGMPRGVRSPTAKQGTTTAGARLIGRLLREPFRRAPPLAEKPTFRQRHDHFKSMLVAGAAKIRQARASLDRSGLPVERIAQQVEILAGSEDTAHGYVAKYERAVAEGKGREELIPFLDNASTRYANCRTVVTFFKTTFGIVLPEPITAHLDGMVDWCQAQRTRLAQ